MLEWTGQTAALGPTNAVVLRKLFVAVRVLFRLVRMSYKTSRLTLSPPPQLSSLIIRLSPNGFPNPFLTLLTLLTPAPTSSSPPSLALPLEFFQITVEEVSRTGLIGQRKMQIHDVLEEGSQVAVGSCLGVLKRWLEDGGGDKGREREEELTAATSCLEVWIGWGLSGEWVLALAYAHPSFRDQRLTHTSSSSSQPFASHSAAADWTTRPSRRVCSGVGLPATGPVRQCPQGRPGEQSAHRANPRLAAVRRGSHPRVLLC